MFDFIKADILRILKKKSYIITSSIVFISYAATLAVMFVKHMEKFDLINSMLASMATFLVGIPVFNAVFTDDFNSKAMQTIIGHGTTRKDLVLSRHFEYSVILAQAFAVISLMILAISAATGQMPNGTSMIGYLWTEYLVVICCMGFSMMFIYSTQNTTAGLVVFIIMTTNVIGMAMAGMSFIPFLSRHNIDPSAILPSSLIYGATTNGKLYYLPIAFLIYVVAALIVSCKAFEKKELEF